MKKALLILAFGLISCAPEELQQQSDDDCCELVYRIENNIPILQIGNFSTSVYLRNLCTGEQRIVTYSMGQFTQPLRSCYEGDK